MSPRKNQNNEIDKWILANPKAPNEVGYYGKIAELFGIHPEKARKRWRMLQRQGAIQNKKIINPKIVDIGGGYIKVVEAADFVQQKDIVVPQTTLTTTSNKTTHFKSNGTGSIQVTTKEKIETLSDLIRVCKIDTEKYNVADYNVKSYNAWIKNEAGQIESQQLFAIHANLKVKRVDDNIEKQKDIILDAIRKASEKKARVGEPVNDFIIAQHPADNRIKDTALEINIPDLHIGKLAWSKETGEDYDIKIAVERYKKAIRELLSRVNPNTLEKIILPVGNDMINVDNKGNTTTAGTNVSCDSRFGKMFQTAKELLIDTISKLSEIAPVEVMIVPGNHDTVAMFTLGEVLDAWFHNNELVTVINTHTPRKYLQYGLNLLMYCHGHNEKLQDLGIICATEQPHLWAATKFRRVHVGHFHHSKQIKFTDVQEYPGFTVKVLNSLSANDAWHAEKGYMSLKGAEAFLYHRDKGLIANYYYLNQ